VCAAAALLTGGSGAVAPAEDAELPGGFNVRIGNERAAAAVRRAVAGARDRLKQAACGEVLHRFRDADGRTLQENLETTGQSSERYLATRVFFYEGYRQPTCRSRRATKGLAVTSPGARAVFVCTSRFTDVEKRNPMEAQAIIIHEMLHTLGLGENPPSSDEITAAVIEACAG
jgi:hypothetical protein